MSFDKNCMQYIASESFVTFSYLQWVWHKAIKVSKKFTVNLIKVDVIENDHQINNGFRLPHFLKNFLNEFLTRISFWQSLLAVSTWPCTDVWKQQSPIYNLCQGCKPKYVMWTYATSSRTSYMRYVDFMVIKTHTYYGRYFWLRKDAVVRYYSDVFV